MDVVENNRPELIHACRLEETSKCLRNMMSEKLDQKSGYECLHPRLMASTAHRVSLGFKSSQVGDDPDEIIIQTYG